MDEQQTAPIANDARPTIDVVIEELETRGLDAVAADMKNLRETFPVMSEVSPGMVMDSLRTAYEDALDTMVWLKNAELEGHDHLTVWALYATSVRLCADIRRLIVIREVDR